MATARLDASWDAFAGAVSYVIYVNAIEVARSTTPGVVVDVDVDPVAAVAVRVSALSGATVLASASITTTPVPGAVTGFNAVLTLV